MSDSSNQILELEKHADAIAGDSPSIRVRLDRFLQIAKYYRWKQIAIRIGKIVSSTLSKKQVIGKIPSCSDSKLNECEIYRNLAQTIIPFHNGHVSHSQSDLTSGKIVLLNQEYNIGWPLQWRTNAPSHLWRFQLHYHEFLLEHISAQTGDGCVQGAAWETVWKTILDWISHHHPESVPKNSDAWHAYCISRRIPVWVWLLSLSKPKDETALNSILQSLTQQAVSLSRNLEMDVRANHLFENYTALAIAGCVIDCQHSDSWLKLAENGYRQELRQQILLHGEHFERSPMYHCQILGNLLKVGVLAKQASPSLSSLCFEYADKMLQFLDSILHSDQEIPLFSDSCFFEAPSVAQLKQIASLGDIPWSKNHDSFKQAGPYWVYRENESEHADCMIFDRGAVGADELPAHAHSDLLNFEASVNGNRWFVDSGNFFYEAGSMRQYCRSSVAHNIVTVEGQNQCDVYSKFRMGRRGNILNTDSGQTSDFHWASGVHDGYRNIGVHRIERRIAIGHGGTWICSDIVSGKTDRPLIGYLHLAPQLKITHLNDGFQIEDQFECRKIQFFGVVDVKLTDGWYCTAFGFREVNSVFVYRLKSLDLPGGWILSQPNSEIVVDLKKKHLSVAEASVFSNFEWNFN